MYLVNLEKYIAGGQFVKIISMFEENVETVYEGVWMETPNEIMLKEVVKIFTMGNKDDVILIRIQN